MKRYTAETDTEVQTFTLAEFERDNAELDPEELGKLRSLRLGEFFQIGGGAAPLVTIRRLTDSGAVGSFACDKCGLSLSIHDTCHDCGLVFCPEHDKEGEGHYRDGLCMKCHRRN